MLNDSAGSFESSQHAYDAGLVFGMLMASGLDVAPEVNEDGNCTPRIMLTDRRSSLVYVLTVEAT